MNFMSLLGVEFKKIRRSKILFLLFAAAVVLWLPSLLHPEMNFEMQAEGISPEHNFFIQGFLAMSWFMFPAGMIVGTVLLQQTERSNRGLTKMLSLPLGKYRLCLAKFTVLLFLAAIQILMTVGMYYLSAVLLTQTTGYSFLLSPVFVLREAALLLLSAIPMLAFFWLLTVCIRTPIFSVGIGLASLVPSVLLINTRVWFAYPMAYPFYIMTAEYSRLAANLSIWQIELFPWLPVAAGITIACLLLACLFFSKNVSAKK